MWGMEESVKMVCPRQFPHVALEYSLQPGLWEGRSVLSTCHWLFSSASYRANSLVVQHSFIIVLQVFVYPDNVAYPFGGEGFAQYVLMELHYDNPAMISGAATITHNV